jgi:hypothetical protein
MAIVTWLKTNLLAFAVTFVAVGSLLWLGLSLNARRETASVAEMPAHSPRLPGSPPYLQVVPGAAPVTVLNHEPEPVFEPALPPSAGRPTAP